MKQARTYLDYLRDMVEYAEKAERFVEEMNFQDFAKDEMRCSLL